MNLQDSLRVVVIRTILNFPKPKDLLAEYTISDEF